MKKKNPFIFLIAIFAIIWIIGEIVWIIISQSYTSFGAIFSILFLFLFMYSWIRVLSNTSYVGISIYNIIDSVYTVFIYVLTTYNFWHADFVLKYSLAMVIFWWITATFLLFNILLISYILISNTNLGNKALKAIVWKNTLQAQIEVEKKKNMIHLHEILNKIMCVNIEYVFPSKEENMYYAAILGKNPIDATKANDAEFLFVLNKQTIIAVYKFKEDQMNLIEITNDNFNDINNKFKSALINEKSLGKFILNVQKNFTTSFETYVGKDIDASNKSECFYNF